jgi:hypothetical protein
MFPLFVTDFFKRNTYFHFVKLLLKYTYADFYEYLVKTEGRGVVSAYNSHFILSPSTVKCL